MSLLRSLLFFFGAAVAAALAVLCLWVDIRVFGNDIPEVSLTEVVQESVLAVIVLVHLLLARKYAHLRYSNILIGGFFLAMLIRELDGLFDLLSHGSWVWFALLATAGSLLLPLRHLHQTLSQLAAVYPHALLRDDDQRPAGDSGLLAAVWHARPVVRRAGRELRPGGKKYGRGRQRVVWLYAVSDRHPRLRLLLSRSGATGAVAAALIVDDSHRRACLPAVARRRG